MELNWISVDEKLPPCGPIVLVATMYMREPLKGMVHTVHVAHYSTDGKWRWDDDDTPIDPDVKVIHWMPLPEHPTKS